MTAREGELRMIPSVHHFHVIGLQETHQETQKQNIISLYVGT
jgi:hypothetical protein